jgi:hypothetical protein
MMGKKEIQDSNDELVVLRGVILLRNKLKVCLTNIIDYVNDKVENEEELQLIF